MSSDRIQTLVEIGSDSVKLAQFERHGHRVALTKLHYEQAETLGESLVANLRDAVANQGFATHGVIGCLPRHLVTVRMLDLPSLDAAEIAGMVELQFGKQIPYTRDEVIADYRLLGPTSEGYSRVMLVVVQRDTLRERFSLLEDAGLDVEAMTVASEGVARWAAALDGVDDRAPVYVLDIDARASELLIVQAGGILSSRSVSTGAESLGDSDARDRLVNDLRRAMEAMREDVPDGEPERLMLGGANGLSGIREHLESGLGIAVERHPAHELTEDSPVATEAGSVAATASLTSLVGFAVSGKAPAFKLVPEAIRMRRALVKRARSMTVLGLLIIGLLFTGSWYALSKHAVRQGCLVDLQERRAALEPDVERVKHMRAIVRVVDTREDVRFATAALLGAVHAATPQGVFFDTIEIDQAQGRISMRGAGPTRQVIRTLVNNLETSALLVDAKEEGTTTRDSNTGNFRFQVVARFDRG